MNNNFVAQFSENIKFYYTSFDRVILRGYINKLFYEAGVASFLKSMGFVKRSNGVMRIFTDQLNSHISKVATKFDIPILWWPSVDGGNNGAKLDYVEKNFASKYKKLKNHVFCIITDKEPVSTFASRELTSKKTNKTFHRLYKCRKPVKQYYIYFFDEVLGGPCYLKISSYFPFTCEFYFNGHNYIKLQLDKKGISYRTKDNAFVYVSDPDALQKIAQQIDGRLILDRINYWMNSFFKFNKGKYSTRPKALQHQWYAAQVEVCSNTIFKSPRFCTSLFERILDKSSRFGLPDSIAKVFSRRPARSNSRTSWRLYDNNACIKHWFRGNSVKQYNKTGYLIRTETTINNPKSLGLKKPVIYLQAYLWKGLDANNKFLNCCADVDLSSLCDAEPNTFKKPVLDHLNRKVPAPDLRKDRQLALFKELLKAKYSSFGFKTSELRDALHRYFQNSSQIRYELKKLSSRNIVKKVKGKSFYIVTEFGWKWLWATICSNDFFKNPIISRCFKNDLKNTASQPSNIEKSYDLIHQGLTLITLELAMI